MVVDITKRKIKIQVNVFFIIDINVCSSISTHDCVDMGGIGFMPTCSRWTWTHKYNMRIMHGYSWLDRLVPSHVIVVVDVGTCRGRGTSWAQV